MEPAMRATDLAGYAAATGTAGVAAAFCARLAAPFFTVFREAFTGAFFAAVFLAGGCWALAAVFAAALFAAQRFFNAATIAALPAALSLRFGLVASGATGDDGSDSFLDSAHRFRWASPMRFRAAALIFRLRFVGAPGAAVSVGVLVSIWRSSAI